MLYPTYPSGRLCQSSAHAGLAAMQRPSGAKICLAMGDCSNAARKRSSLVRSSASTRRRSASSSRADWYSRALSTAVAARRASSIACARSPSVYTRPDSAEMRLITPSVRPRATSGTPMYDRRPSSRRISRCSASLAAPRSISSVISATSSGRPVRTICAVPCAGAMSVGYRSATSSAERTFAGSTCDTASRFNDPSSPSRSTAHQSAIRGTTSSATAASVVRYSSEEASTSLALDRNAANCSARLRSVTSSKTATAATRPPRESRIGAALARSVARTPSSRSKVISSAVTTSPDRSARVSGHSVAVYAVPSPR